MTTALVLAALPGAALARTVDGGWQQIGVQTCGTPAPTCDAVYSRTVTTAGLLRARYRAPADHLGPVRITFMVDGVAVAASDWVGAGEWAGPFQLGPVSAGQHQLTLRAEGQIDVTSWAGDLELWTNDTEAPLQWNAGDDFVSDNAHANPGPDALGHSGVWRYDGSPSLVRDAGTYTRLAQFTPDWTSAHLAAWYGTELDEGSGIPLPGAAATATGPRQFASGALAPHEVLLHPFTSRLAVLDWHSPVNAVVAITGGLRDIDAFCGDGIGWQVHLDGTKLAEGTLANGAQGSFGAIDPVTVTAGDHLRLSVDPGAADDRFCDSTAVDLTIRTVDPAAEAVTVSGTANIWAAHADPLTGYGSGGDLGTAPVRLELAGGAVTFPAVTGWISCLHTETRNWDGPDGPCGKASLEQHVSAAGGISAYDDSTGNFPLVGVFLAGSQPLAPPDPLDVSGAELTAEIAPALGQVFRIGDGRTASSALQSFVPPPGATELFLALPDAPSFLGSPGSYADDAGTLDVSVSGARTSATLRVIKQVVNDDGGAKVAGDFSLHVKGGAADVAGSPQPGSSSGTSYTLAPGTYDVSEDPVAGYAATFSGDCDAQGQVALVPGESKTCTITNDDIAPTLDPTPLLSYGAPGYRYMQLDDPLATIDGFAAEGYDDSAWKVGPTPFGPVPPTGNCPRTAVTNWDADSALLVRRQFTVPAGTRDVTVHAALDNDVTVYVNGHNITGDVDPARSDGCASADNVGPFPVPAAVLHPGTNLLAVRAIDRGGESHLDLEVTGVVGGPAAPTLRVVKQVVNDGGGTKVEGDFSLHVEGGGADVAGSPRPGSSSGTPYTLEPGTYGVSEDPVAGYAATFSGDCDASGQVALAPGESKTCTITNDDIAPTLRVIKQVVNDDGGSALAADWTMHIRSGLPLEDVAGKSPFAGAESPGVTRTLAAGSYVVSESGGPAGYAASISGDCNAQGQITLAAGESQTCTITNDDIAPTLRVIKQVVNDDGGAKVAGDFSLHVKGGAADVAGSPQPGSSSGTSYTLAPGTYDVSEDPVAGYAATFSGDCDAQGQVALVPGESKTCTITNDDIAPTQRRLTVVIFGSGTVTLPPDGLVCSTTCNKEYVDGDVITITAEPAPGWRFKEWSGGGACSGQVPACEIRMDDAKSVTATFEKLAHALTVSRDGTGSGHVGSAPAGIDCGSDCAQEYDHGTEVTLTATPAADSTFAGWSGGACIGTGACSVSMTQARSVVATFATGRHPLTVVKEGNGSGTVTSAPAGIDCGSDCAETYDHDATVTLTAQADIGSSFFGWSGVSCANGGGDDSCTVPMTQARTVTATFRATTRALRVVKLGVGSGTVTSSPAGIDCGTTCVNDFPTRSTVTLTATAGPGSRFVGWLTAPECPDIGDCTLTLNVDKTIGAKFEPAASHYNLNVFRNGDGRGTVTSAPPGIDCGRGDCSQSYADGTEVTLTAAPNAGSTFIGWHGACTGTATCTVSMGAPREVWATFGLATEPGVWSLARDFRTNFDGTPSNPAADARGNPDVWSFLYSDGSPDLDTVREPDAYHVLSEDFSSPLLGWREPGLEFVEAWMADQPGTHWPPHAVMLHPSVDRLAVVAWTSPVDGHVQVTGGLTDEDPSGGDGVRWFVSKNAADLASGAIGNGSCATQAFHAGAGGASLRAIPVGAGDVLYFAVDPRGPDGDADPNSDTTALDVTIREVPADAPPPNTGIWSLQEDMRRAPIQQNPNFDAYGHLCAWSFEQGDSVAHDAPSSPLSVLTQGYAGQAGLEAWTGSETMPVWNLPVPSVGLNTGTEPMTAATGTWPVGKVVVQPSATRTARVHWRAPFTGYVRISGAVQDLDATGGDGVLWFVDRGSTTLASGAVHDGAQAFAAGLGGGALGAVEVTRGEVLSVVVAPGLTDSSDTTGLDLVIDQVATPQHTLTLLKDGAGSGRVGSVPAGIDCGSDCTESYDHGTTVTLTAAAAEGSRFAGWSGDGCTGTGGCTVALDAARTVTATFQKLEHALTVARDGTGSGHVGSAPAGIDCGSDCAQGYEHGTELTLTATPAADSTFAGWSGGCSGDGACTVSMTAARSVTATFAKKRHELRVTKEGDGSVTSAPAGIDCGGDCAESYDHGTTVTLSAAAAGGSRFAGWSGDGSGCGETPDCTVAMNQSRDVVARFEKVRRILDVSKPGNGVGTVTSEPAGISCGSTCAAGFDDATEVTLTAVAAAGSRFTGWNGGDCSGTGACRVTMDASKSVQATFERNVARRILTAFKITDGFAKAGTVRADPAGDRNFDCGPRCTTGYDDGTHVTLTVVEPLPPGTHFAGWSGDCKGTALRCALDMNAGKLVTARFVLTDPKPRIGRAGTAKAVRGTVLVQRPGTAAPARASTLQEPPPAPPAFVPLDALEAIPVGSIVDVTHGTVELTVTNAKGKTEKIRASGGLFKFSQVRSGRSKGVATLELTGASFDACGRSRRSIRKLGVSGAGTAFRVRGRASEGTSRRGTWTTDDRCHGTVTKVRQGAVSVRDLARRATITVRKGRSHTVRAKGRR